MAGVSIPMVVVFCLAAFVMVLLLYLCMRRMRQPPDAVIHDTKYEEMMLPGEPRDNRHRVSYFLVNSANTANVDLDYPKHDPDVDRTETLQEYRNLHRKVGLSSRGFAQIVQARDVPYDRILRRVVCVYAANTKRCLVTASELLKIGPGYGKGDRKAPRCPAFVNPVDEMSQFGVMQEVDGKAVPSNVGKHVTQIEDVLAGMGSNECDLDTLYSHQAPGADRPVKSLMKSYTKPAVYKITRDLVTDNKSCLQQLADNDAEDDVVLIVGQTPYINAVGIYLADSMGVTSEERGLLMEQNLGDLDGFLVSRRKVELHDFNDDQSVIEELMSKSTYGEPF